MVRLMMAIGSVLALVTALATAQDALPRELVAMADAERAFAKTATVNGWRDAFLEFFADDAVALGREVTLAKDGLRKQPSPPFSEFELVWEPRLGDVAASADLGWLTGPSTSINHTAKDPKPGHGCYLSVWRKQPNGTWRVFIDVGAGAPEPVPFAPGFTRMPFGDRYVGKAGEARQGSGGEEPGRSGSRSERTDGGARSQPGLRQPRHPIVAPPSPRIDADRRRRGHCRVVERARVGSRCEGRRCRSGRRGRLRLHLRHLRDQDAQAAIGRLPPALEPRRRRTMVADGGCRPAVPAVGGVWGRRNTGSRRRIEAERRRTKDRSRRDETAGLDGAGRPPAAFVRLLGAPFLRGESVLSASSPAARLR